MINNQLLDHLDINSSLKGRYKLYQTDNIYTFLQFGHKDRHDRTGSMVFGF